MSWNSSLVSGYLPRARGTAGQCDDESGPLYLVELFLTSSKDRNEATKRLGALEIGRMAAFKCPLAMMPNLFRSLIVKGA